MQRYLLYFSYDGTRYHGWQAQPHAISVQQELEQALSTILRQKVEVTGAGRTDAGVHARQMAAHFDLPQPLAQLFPVLADPAQLVYKLNRLLPRDIAADRLLSVSPDFHARFSATKRTYHYYIHTQKDPFLRHYSCELHYPLRFDLMNEAAAYLLEVDDFGAFCKTHTDVKTTICHVTEARWLQDSPTNWHFVISANRFLRNMVRAVVGTLIEVGRGRISLEQFRSIVASRSRSNAGDSMPGNALFLERVEYEADSL